MNLRKHAVTFVAVLTLAGTASIPAGAFQATSSQTQPINAEFVPTQQEVQIELTIGDNLTEKLLDPGTSLVNRILGIQVPSSASRQHARNPLSAIRTRLVDSRPS